MNFKFFSIYRLGTGEILDLRLGGGGVVSEVDVPSGCGLIEGCFDHMCRRVELRPDDFGNAVVPVVVAYQPPRPSDTALKTWAWDAQIERWVGTPTAAAVAAEVRAERDRRMAAADWVTLRSVRTGQPIPAEWAAYLQALADIPLQSGFPYVIDWPTPPAS